MLCSAPSVKTDCGTDGALHSIILDNRICQLLFTPLAADGITYSFGVFLVELIDVFQSDRGETSLIISILVGVTLGSGE